MPFGRPMVTNESRVTPRSRYARARRLVRASSAALESVTDSHVIASRAGFACASRPTSAPTGVSALIAESVFALGHDAILEWPTLEEPADVLEDQVERSRHVLD